MVIKHLLIFLTILSVTVSFVRCDDENGDVIANEEPTTIAFVPYDENVDVATAVAEEVTAVNDEGWTYEVVSCWEEGVCTALSNETFNCVHEPPCGCACSYVRPEEHMDEFPTEAPPTARPGHHMDEAGMEVPDVPEPETTRRKKKRTTTPEPEPDQQFAQCRDLLQAEETDCRTNIPEGYQNCNFEIELDDEGCAWKCTCEEIITESPDATPPPSSSESCERLKTKRLNFENCMVKFVGSVKWY